MDALHAYVASHLIGVQTAVETRIDYGSVRFHDRRAC
jgi:hypothetical protein